ncbi:MAG: biotin/lipoyl-binding protein [Alphaproteobacteria bacterium]|nr:biotin/lipoyl-binding protein [Alphaproteobacteria bacterium]
MNLKALIKHIFNLLYGKFQVLRKSKYSFDVILGTIAVMGVLGGLVLIYDGRRPPRTAVPLTAPAASYFKSFIAGSGLVETESENIELSTLVGGVVDKIFVDVGAQVKAGTPLFSLDNRQAQDDIVTQKATVNKAKATLKQIEASLKDAKDKYDLAQNLKDRRAMSQDDYLARQNAYLIAQNASLAAQADLSIAEASLKRSQTNLDILTIKAPIDCEILQINIHPGEYAQVGPLTTPLMLVGNVKQTHVRINIDENDAWRFSPGASAIAYLRGNSAVRIELEYDHVEPYVLPKRSLTGDSSERVDIRVLQPIYRFKSNPPIAVYIGQQVDVFIEVPESLSYENVLKLQEAVL